MMDQWRASQEVQKARCLSIPLAQEKTEEVPADCLIECDFQIFHVTSTVKHESRPIEFSSINQRPIFFHLL